MRITINEIDLEVPPASKYNHVVIWGFDLYTETWSIYTVEEVIRRWTTLEQYEQKAHDGSLTRDDAYQHVVAWMPRTKLVHPFDPYK